MSERSIKRSVWHKLAPVFAIGAMFGFRGMDAATSHLDDTKKSKFRNNWTQRVDAKVAKVRRWRKRNRVASKSRAMNRSRA